MKAGWEVRPLGEVADHVLGKMLDKHKNKGSPKPYLRNLNVRWFDFDLSDVLEMKFEDHEYDRYTARRGDVLVCEGGYPGRAAIWEKDDPIFFQKAVHRVRFKDPSLAEWFVFYLYFSDATGQLREHFSGTGIQHFTGRALAKFPLPIPPPENLDQALKKLRDAMIAIENAEMKIEAQLADLATLRQSILARAFRGELT